MKMPGVTLSPAAMPMPIPRQRYGPARVKSESTRASRARLICPLPSVVYTGSAHRQTAARTMAGEPILGAPTRRHDCRATSTSSARFARLASTWLSCHGIRLIGTKTIAANGG